MLTSDLQTEIAVLRYQIKQKRADYDEAAYAGRKFDELRRQFATIREMEVSLQSLIKKIERIKNAN